MKEKRITMNEFIENARKLKRENELLKEQLKILKDEITTIYNDMIALDTINEKELEEIEEL